MIRGEGAAFHGGIAVHLKLFHWVEGVHDFFGDDVPLSQQRHQLRHAFTDRHFSGAELDFRFGRRLVRAVDARESADLSLTRLFVQTLKITRLANGKRSGDVDLEERQAGCGVSSARSVAIFGVRRDEGAEADDAAIGEQFGDLGDAPDVLHAVFGGESQVLVQALSNIVTVQTVGRNAARYEEFFQGES